MTTIINGSSPSITFSDGSAQTSATQPFQNRIINGDMTINQRALGTVTINTSGTYTIDRWQANQTSAGKFTVQQSSTAPTGFKNSYLATSTSAYSVSSSDIFFFNQNIEGFNMADLDWGTANAKTVTLSAWVQSSLTGTFGGAIANATQGYCYPFTYSIPTANTWTKISVTIAGPTTGTWESTNGIGMQVIFALGGGSTRSAAAGAWTTSAVYTANGAVSVVGTSGATLFLTGVQLEVGSTATSFDYRPYTTELQLCQRYYAKLGGTNTDANAGIGAGLFNSAGTVARCYFSYPVPMRTKPTVSQSNAGLNDISSGYNVTSINTTWVTTTSMMLDLGSSPSGTGFRPIIFTLAASNGYVDVSAEL